MSPKLMRMLSTDMKLAIFDLDGVLVNTSEIHTRALRQAVGMFAPYAHTASYLDAGDGIRTVEKLQRLKGEFHLTEEIVNMIGDFKKLLTLQALENIQRDEKIVEAIKYVKGQAIKIAIASNSRREFVDKILNKLGIQEFVDFTVCGDEVSKPKPDPELFLKAASALNISPLDSVVFEDSDIGLLAARNAGMKSVRIDPSILITLEIVKGA